MARPTEEKKDAIVKVRLSPDLNDKVKEIARHKCISVSEYVRMVLKESVKGC